MGGACEGARAWERDGIDGTFRSFSSLYLALPLPSGGGGTAPSEPSERSLLPHWLPPREWCAPMPEGPWSPSKAEAS